VKPVEPFTTLPMHPWSTPFSRGAPTPFNRFRTPRLIEELRTVAAQQPELETRSNLQAVLTFIVDAVSRSDAPIDHYVVFFAD
jgi:hypothetical protein